ncbi:MAG: 3-phosphoshikimate 1-carboxyvinyltransferase, partial [Chitinophagaceae bacterium]
MQVKISPSTISGQVSAPASKSAMQRACALALLHSGTTIIRNAGHSNDDKAALSIIQQLGAVVTKKSETELEITGANFPNGTTSPGGNAGGFSCGESGLSIRMFTPLAALSTAPITVTGSGSLLSRPMHFFDEVLPALGVEVSSKNGYLPLQVQGPLVPKEITVDGSLSSQFLTGLLLAFAKAASRAVSIYVTNLKSKPYIDLTLQMMEHFGYKLSHQNYEQFNIEPVAAKQRNINYAVEGDWSGAAFLLVAGAIAGKISVTGLDVFSAQADRAILQALMMSNAVMSITTEDISVAPGKLQAFQFDATDCPDLFPPLVALAALCEGKSVIEGVSRLAHKESNRALTLQEEFGKMGVSITIQDDVMIVEGTQALTGALVSSHHDHRIAMALAVAGLRAQGITTINDAEAINK